MIPSNTFPGRPMKGSRLQICAYVNRAMEELNRRVLEAIGAAGGEYKALRWVSPLEAEEMEEYRDAEFLRRIGLGHLQGSLLEFWPQKGPSWDALAVADGAGESGQRAVILVEAKSHRLEICSSGCGAGADSKRKIDAALVEAKLAYKAEKRVEWDSYLYQYANRLAHLHFLREIVTPPVDAWMVNLYFTDDPYRPTSEAQWRDFLPEAKWALGLMSTPSRCVDVYLPAIAG